MVEQLFKATPDLWQREALDLFPTSNRLALKACKGPGKTTVLAWLIWNFLLTRPQPKIQCAAITGANLDSNLWPELAKWQGQAPILLDLFTWTKTAITHKQHPATWWAQARSFSKSANPEQQADALAGLHADYAMVVLDESGGMPSAIMATAEAVLASGIETKVLQSGNPTHLSGPLYNAVSRDRHLWNVVTITGDPDDPKRSPRISMEWARQQIASYGRDNPWVMVNVLGQFPPSSINALLGVDEVERAMGRKLDPDLYTWSQKRIGVDVARFGDDRNVLFPRQGLKAFNPIVSRNERTTDTATRAAMAATKWGAAILLVDDTGHWGHGVIDNLIAGGFPAMGIIFSDKALNSRYKNRRAEMWLEMAKWVKAGGSLPFIPELIEELIAATYTFLGGVFVLEEKDQIKERIGRSPDLADALALTFAIPDMPADMMRVVQSGTTTTIEIDPFEQRDSNSRTHTTDWDPFTEPA